MNWKIASSLLAAALTTSVASFAGEWEGQTAATSNQCPPPQRMPFDFGISAVLGAGAVAAAYKARKRKQASDNSIE